MRPCVFVHTNHKQQLGAAVSAWSLQRASRRPDGFEVRILQREDHAFFDAYEGRRYLRDGTWRTWRNDDLQSFTPLRFMPPELMDYRGRALVIDPDVFAVGDVLELLERDMGGKAILCRRRAGWKKRSCWASSVMLLDCARLRDWHCEEAFAELFEGRRDYAAWICLRLEPPERIGLLEDAWNDFDRLRPETRLLHNTRRWTQPWKRGLPVDFVPGDRATGIGPVDRLMRLRREWLGERALLGRYVRHPDRRQEQLFFGLLREGVEKGAIPEALVREEVRRGHVRRDALALMERAPAPSA